VVSAIVQGNVESAPPPCSRDVAVSSNVWRRAAGHKCALFGLAVGRLGGRTCRRSRRTQPWLPDAKVEWR
jgi:hypothetical protein